MDNSTNKLYQTGKPPSMPIAGGVALNIPSRQPIVSQLHTPLGSRSLKLDTLAQHSPLAVGPSAVKRETISHDPLGSSRSGKEESFSLKGSNDLMRSASESSPSIISQSTSLPSAKVKSIEMLTSIFMTASGGESTPPPMTLDNIPQNLFGLNELIHAGAWKQVVELSTKLLKDANNTSPFSGITLLHKLRWEGLFHMKLFDELAIEVHKMLAIEESLISKVSVADESHQSMLPLRRSNIFALELVQAEVKAMTGHGEDAIEQLYKLRAALHPSTLTLDRDDNIQDDVGGKEVLHILLWRVDAAITNAMVRMRFWRRAVDELQITLKTVRTMAAASAGDCGVRLGLAEITVLCRLSRMYLQIGAMNACITSAQTAKTLWQQRRVEVEGAADISTDDISLLEDHVTLAEGLALFGQDQYEAAVTLFKRILDGQVALSRRCLSSPTDASAVFGLPSMSPTSPTGSTGGDPSGSKLFSGDAQSLYFPRFDLEDDSLMAAAANDYAICALNLRQLPKAVETLERLIRSNPVRNMLDPVVFNLCTMYDLSCSPEVSTTKKKVLQKIAVMYNVDDLHWRSFRLG